jgi:DNA (cytosine-5)-methyltransferase 1
MLPSAVCQLLPTPTAADSKASGAHGYNGNEFCALTDATVRLPQQWGKCAAAIARWEQLTRPAPAPTIPGKNGRPRLNPQFSEWMMGWPAGWVTDVPGMRDPWKHHAIGNGVVPQQAAAAIRWCLTAIDRYRMGAAA